MLLAVLERRLPDQLFKAGNEVGHLGEPHLFGYRLNTQRRHAQQITAFLDAAGEQVFMNAAASLLTEDA